MDSVVFKKKAKKNSAVRKRVREVDEDPEGVAEQQQETLQSIEELREDQKLRTQLLRSELQAAKLARASDEKGASATAAAASDTTQYGLHDPRKDGSAGQKLLNLLDGQFTGQTGVTQRDQYEELANKYIEEKLQKRAKVDTAESTPVPVLTDEDALYAELRKEIAASSSLTEESTNGGVLIWNTGIAEVELPSTYQDKTIRETKKALERETASAKNKIQSSALPANFSTDFNRHRTDHVAELKSLSREDQRNRGFVATKKDKPSDDHAVSRFRMMESRRRRK